jgi:hypothetical protein
VRNKHVTATNLEVAQLCELFPTVLKLANVRFLLFMDDFVCPYVAPLGEALAANLAMVWPFAGMAAFVGLFATCQKKKTMHLFKQG